MFSTFQHADVENLRDILNSQRKDKSYKSRGIVFSGFFEYPRLFFVSALDLLQQLRDLTLVVVDGLDADLNLVDGGDDCGMVSSEDLADLL